ncbi:MAG: UDP-N-acetylmuramoyl-L-alanine--D-glutamate ligase [Acidimicrobiales bacterium]
MSTLVDRPGEALVVGYAVTGQAAAEALAGRGWSVRAIDDAPLSELASQAAADVGVEVVSQPTREELAEAVASAGLIVLSPGVSPSHGVFALGDPARIISEIELAFQLAADAGTTVIAVTGTNGKTTVTSLVTEILRADGRKAEAAGNIGRPFVEAVLAHEAEIFVVEVSSFQLAWTKTFRPGVACWLNFAEDHLDWHGDLAEYAAAKARIWANQQAGDVSVVNCEDVTVMKHALVSPGSLVTFGLDNGDYRERDGALFARDAEICRTGQLPRSLRHDRSNALAAAAVARSAGASIEACRSALVAGVPMPHRIELVVEENGLSWFDDSKATTPSAVAAALDGFDSVVLIAGGRNKGLDLRPMRSEATTGTLLGVVAIGEAAGEIAEVFKDVTTVERASTMATAVETADRLARARGARAVLLSPGCASFDWYRNYGDRGEDFARRVKEHLDACAPSSKGRDL